MKSVLKLPAGTYEDLVAHLLPVDTANEQAAFLFAVVKKTEQGVTLDVIDSAKLVAATLRCRHLTIWSWPTRPGLD